MSQPSVPKNWISNLLFPGRKRLEILAAEGLGCNVSEALGWGASSVVWADIGYGKEYWVLRDRLPTLDGKRRSISNGRLLVTPAGAPERNRTLVQELGLPIVEMAFRR